MLTSDHRVDTLPGTPERTQLVTRAHIVTLLAILAPFEPLLVILEAVVIAGAWRRPYPAALLAAGVARLVAATAVFPQVPNSLRSWPDYGIVWPSIFNRPAGRLTGAAGFNVPAFDGLATLTATSLGTAPARFRVRIGGVHVRTMDVAPGATETIRTRWPRRGLAFIELDQIDHAGERTAIEVRVPGR